MHLLVQEFSSGYADGNGLDGFGTLISEDCLGELRVDLWCKVSGSRKRNQVKILQLGLLVGLPPVGGALIQ